MINSSRIPIGDIYIITKSSPEQFSISKIKTKKIGGEIKPVNEHENAIKLVHEVPGTSNSKFIWQFLIGGRLNNLDIYYLSQYYFNSPKRKRRENSNKIFSFIRTLKDIESIYRDAGGYDIKYEDFNIICPKSWEEVFNY